MLSGRVAVISEIRAQDENIGLRNYEINFLKLMEKISNGTIVSINKTGTKVVLKPGVVTNNESQDLAFDCGLERSIVWYLEAVLPLALFGKSMLRLKLTGTTNCNLD